jgi:hypothetical protein
MLARLDPVSPGRQNTAMSVPRSGLVSIAIYHRVTERFLNSEEWWKIKDRFRLPEQHRFRRRSWDVGASRIHSARIQSIYSTRRMNAWAIKNARAGA